MTNSDLLIYQAPDGRIKIDVRLEDETVWLTQAHLCELFQKSKATISEHIKHIFEECELNEESVVRNFRTTATDERFKSGSSMNYFTELQERIREIRLSERFLYQKIKDIYTTSIDYDPGAESTIDFFKVMQNKLLWAISEQIAAELVYRRADASLPLMGMQSFDKAGAPLRKGDAGIAKNYLNEDEIKLLGLQVEQYSVVAYCCLVVRTL